MKASKQRWSVPRRGHLSSRHWKLWLTLSLPAIHGEVNAVGIGGGVQVGMGSAGWLWRSEVMVVLLASWRGVGDEGLIDFGRLAQTL